MNFAFLLYSWLNRYLIVLKLACLLFSKKICSFVNFIHLENYNLFFLFSIEIENWIYFWYGDLYVQFPQIAKIQMSTTLPSFSWGVSERSHGPLTVLDAIELWDTECVPYGGTPESPSAILSILDTKRCLVKTLFNIFLCTRAENRFWKISSKGHTRERYS